MGWQGDRNPRAGQVPGPGERRPAPTEGFAHGGPWAAASPSAAVAAALEAAAGPQDRYDGADTDALVGIVSRWAAVESWAAAGKLAALRAMMREDGGGAPLLRRRPELPDAWDDSLNYEIAEALAMGPVSAGNLAHLAWTLGTRLPGTGHLLADGTLTAAKAKLIAAIFQPLDEGEAARAEALIMGEVAGKTYFQVERLAWRAALAVAPDVAERRRSQAERERARVTLFREESGAVGLSGRDLPAAQALAGHANIVARAKLYEASGVFPGQSTSSLEALAYLHLLNGATAADAIAFARTAAEPPDGGPGNDGQRDQDGEDPGGPGPGGGDDDGYPGDENPGSGPGPDGGSGPDGACDSPSPEGDHTALPELTVPLATLQGHAARAGENRLLGPLDPALARDLAEAAARSPCSRWEVTVVDQQGYAAGHGIARPRRGAGQPPRPRDTASCALPTRINITVTVTRLRQLAAQAAQPRSGAPPGGWGLTPRTPDTWVLTLPGGRELAVRFDVVPTHDCDHTHEVDSYQPSQRLRRLVQVRDRECTFPPCSRPARESDFEHAVPYDQGGKTDACNAGARSRRCHQVKQTPGVRHEVAHALSELADWRVGLCRSAA
jgi:hypothetical protein